MFTYAPLAKITASVMAAATLIACDSASVTSVAVRGTAILEDSEFYSCDPYTVDLSGTRLMAKDSDRASTYAVKLDIPPGEYEIYLHYEDHLHSDPDQPDQLGEIWYLEGRNADDAIAMITSFTKDLPKDEVASYTNVGIYDLTDIDYVIGRHGSTSPEYVSIVPSYNSIEPTLVELYPVNDECYDPVF